MEIYNIRCDFSDGNQEVHWHFAVCNKEQAIESIKIEISNWVENAQDAYSKEFIASLKEVWNSNNLKKLISTWNDGSCLTFELEVQNLNPNKEIKNIDFPFEDKLEDLESLKMIKCDYCDNVSTHAYADPYASEIDEDFSDQHFHCDNSECEKKCRDEMTERALDI